MSDSQTTATPEASASTLPTPNGESPASSVTQIATKTSSESGAEEPAAEKAGLLKAFSYATRKDITFLVIATICAVGQGAVQPINMLFLGDSINSIGSGDMGSAFDVLVRNFAIIAVIGFALGTVAMTLFEYCAEKQVALIKRNYVHGILQQEIGFYDLKDPGSLATDIEQSCVKVRDGIGMKFGLIFQMASQFIAGYTVALIRGWKLALVMTAVVPIIGAAMTSIMLFMRKSVKRSEEAYNEGGSIVEEIIPAMRTVASFGLEQHFIESFGKKIDNSEAADKRSNTLKALSFGVMFFILICSYALGWWYGTTLVVDAISQHMDFTMGGKVITVFSSIMVASFSLGQVGPNVSSLASAAESVQSVVTLSERVSPINPFADSGDNRKGLKGHIVFKNVRFAYPSRPDRNIYSDVSFEIKPGETVALVGASGCGKSTVIQLIERFYDATGGVIELDGRDITSYNIRSLREQMALVSQEPKLFSASVKDNIVCGAADVQGVTDPEMIAAAKAANAHDFVMTFPMGYDTSVGQAGSLLSGGQKQRVAIARAILRDPAVMILDEATSALDNESEKVVQRALDDLVKMKKRTTIIIAHRLTTIRTADKIIVFDNPDGEGSRVIESGTHEELLRIPNGMYKGLVEAQQIIATQGHEETTRLEQRLNAAMLSKRLSQDELKMSPGNTQRHSRDAAVGRFLTQQSRLSRLSRQESRRSKHSMQGLNSKTSILDDTALEPLASARIRRLWTYSFDRWYLALIGFIGSACAGAIFPVLFLIISEFVGAFYSPDTDAMQEEGNKRALWLVGMAVASGLAMFTQQEAWGRLGEGLVSKMRRTVFEEMVYQDMEFFDSPENNTGHLSSILSADCALTRGITGENLSLILQNTFTLVIAIIIAFSGNAKLAAVALAAYSLMVPAIYFQARMNKPMAPARTTNETRFDPETTHFVLNEIVTNLRPIAAYNLQFHFEDMYGVALRKESGLGLWNALVSGIFSGLATGLQSAANCITFWYAGYLINHETALEVSTIMRTIMVMLNAGAGLGRASAFATDQKRAKTAVQNMFSIIDRPSAVDARNGHGDKNTSIKGNFEFDEITFRYPTRPNVPILSEVSFSVKAGQAVALCGASGSGKSTIIQFIERFYDVEASTCFRLQVKEAALDPDASFHGTATDLFGGSVKLEKQNIRTYNTAYLRRNMGLVSQEPVLFVGSIADNIRHGKLDATDEEIRRAAEMANAAEFIEKLPEKYDTPVGRGGGQMSGGQKQRIAIARALIRDPPILLFDEATSALDPESEATVQKTLDKLIQGGADGKKKTSITIAHRLSTIRNADKIVIFGPRPGIGSHIVEQGSHDELMKIENGVYRHLVEISQEDKNKAG